MTRLAALLWLILAAPALATVDTWPALYDVAFVEADDTLNIRAGDGTGHAVIGTLAHDATGVEVTAVNEAETWGRVNTGEQSGWVSMAYLDRQPGQYENVPPAFSQCFGTEPFWSLTQGADTLDFSSPEGGWSRPLAATTSSRNVLNRHAFAADGVTLIVTHAACTDGMSDRYYGLAADLVILASPDPVMLSGCCTIAPD